MIVGVRVFGSVTVGASIVRTSMSEGDSLSVGIARDKSEWARVATRTEVWQALADIAGGRKRIMAFLTTVFKSHEAEEIGTSSSSLTTGDIFTEGCRAPAAGA